MIDGSGASGRVCDGVPPLLITTRFGLGVKDLAWLDHRIALISSITAPSLLAQRDRNFHWVVFTDPDLPASVRAQLADILAPFDGRAYLCPKGSYGTGVTLAAGKELGIVKADEYLLTGRIDDDDAWSRDAVGVVRRRVAQWLQKRHDSPGVGITFEYGLEWVMYDMVDIDILQNRGRTIERKAAIRPYMFPFLATSVFILARLSSKITALSASHSRMGRWLEEEGYDVDVVVTDRPMWVYCRHKQAESGIQKSKGDDVQMTVKELATEFGLDEARTSRYLANSDKYGYGVSKRSLKQRGDLQKELRAVGRQIRDPAVSEAEKVQLRLKEAKLADEIDQVGENMVGEVDESSVGP